MHHSDKPAAREKWDEAVKKMCKMFDESYTDPFDVSSAPENLVNIATGVIATEDVTQSMCGWHKTGMQTAQKFVKERLMTPEGQNTPQKSFFDTMPRSGVKTMAEMNAPVRVKSKSVKIDSEMMYLRLMAVNARKKVPLERVMSHENTAVPLSICKDDGTKMTCEKSHFMSKLESILPETIANISSANCIIYDASVTIRALKPPSDTANYKALASNFTSHLVQKAQLISSHVEEIHIIFDRYFDDSIKNQTRQVRGARSDTGGSVHHITPDGIVPVNYSAFLERSENKAGLAKYYTEYIMGNASLYLSDHHSMYLSGGAGDRVVNIKRTGVTDIPHLYSNQEEADTRLVLHAADAANRGNKTIVIHSQDTDVLVLLLHHRPAIKAEEIFLYTGTQAKHTDKKRFIPIHTLFDAVTREQHNIMLAGYCLTGCDSTSSFFGHGKRKAFGLIMKKASKFQGMADLGTGPLNKAQQEACTAFVGALYGEDDCTSLNDIRCKKAKEVQKNIKKMPPTDNSLLQHMLRCIYQLCIWRTALSAVQDPPCATEYGYERDTVSKKLVPKWMSQPPAVPELLNDLVCTCAPNKCHEHCTCLDNEQPCTAACACEAALPGLVDAEIAANAICTNPLTVESLYQIDLSDSDSDSE